MLFIAKVMACGFITFYSLPEAVPFLVRLTMMVATQVAVGKALQREQKALSNDQRPIAVIQAYRQHRLAGARVIYTGPEASAPE